MYPLSELLVHKRLTVAPAVCTQTRAHKCSVRRKKGACRHRRRHFLLSLEKVPLPLQLECGLSVYLTRNSLELNKVNSTFIYKPDRYQGSQPISTHTSSYCPSLQECPVFNFCLSFCIHLLSHQGKIICAFTVQLAPSRKTPNRHMSEVEGTEE